MAVRQRDAARSRRRILDAAEQAFAEHGYEGASLAEIAREAGVSAALPAYFFGDKAELHKAVVARLFADRDQALGPVCDDALADLDDPRHGLEVALRTLIAGYLQFLLDRPSFVQLMARDAVDRERLEHMSKARHSSVFSDGLGKFLARLDLDDSPSVNPDHLLVSIVALCFFPLEHDSTMLSSMGYRARTPAYVERRTDHVVDLLMRALAPRSHWPRDETAAGVAPRPGGTRGDPDRTAGRMSSSRQTR